MPTSTILLGSVRSRRRRAALVLAGLGLVGTAGMTVVADPATAATSPSSYEAATINFTNAARTSHHEAKVSPGSCLHTLALAQAKKMAAQQKLFHQDLGPVLTTCHRREVAENIAYGYPSGSSVVTAWMNSTGHRANILHASYQRIGVGAVQDSHGRWWVSELFGRAA